MQDLSLHLLDIAENSIRAQAQNIQIELHEVTSKNQLILRVSDDGKGMEEEIVKNVVHPYVTTRTTRKVGLGLPLLYHSCISARGSLKIQSKLHEGTLIEAVMQYDHTNRLPIGDVASSLVILIQGNPDVELMYTHTYENKRFVFSTCEVKQILGTVSIYEPEIIQWLKRYIREHIADLYS